MAVSSKAAQAAANRALLTVCREAVFIDPDGNEVGQRWPLVLNDDGALTNPAEVSAPFGAYRVRLFADDGTPQGDIDLLAGGRIVLP
jgi:hypothetical protein